MDQKDQILENVKAMHRIAQKIQADINEAGMGSPGTNGRGAELPHLSRREHTTSYALFVSVPEGMAPDVSAALEYLTTDQGPSGQISQGPTNLAVLEAIIQHAKGNGWLPTKK